MCIYKVCSFCGGRHLGLTMAWRASGRDHFGHVCYGCEDRICNEIVAGTTDVKWLESIGGCE